jgi:hypothetical protein
MVRDPGNGYGNATVVEAACLGGQQCRLHRRPHRFLFQNLIEVLKWTVENFRGVDTAILRDICACLTSANKSFMQWESVGWSFLGQTWTNLCWSLCLRHVVHSWLIIGLVKIFGPHTLSDVLQSEDPNHLREFSHMLQSGMLCEFKLLQFFRLLSSLSKWSMTLMMLVELHRVSKWKWRPLTELKVLQPAFASHGKEWVMNTWWMWVANIAHNHWNPGKAWCYQGHWEEVVGTTSGPSIPVPTVFQPIDNVFSLPKFHNSYLYGAHSVLWGCILFLIWDSWGT